MGQIIREAAREWLRAVLRAVPARGGFPVLTGAAKSTLVPLGRFLKVAVPVIPTVDRFGRFRGDRRAEGEAASQFFITDVPRGGAAGEREYSFSWSNDVLHYYINEFYGLIPYAPWETVEKGEIAFLSYIEDALERRLPNLKDYIGFNDG